MSDRPRILIVDQARGALIFQETLLRRRQNEVLSAITGSEAVILAREHRPHLIMFVFDLFDMTAPEFCREIRGDVATHLTSLLLVAERNCPEQVDLCMAAGCNDIVYRPLDRRDLDLKIEKLTTIPVRRQLRTITKIEISVERNGRFLLGRSVNISANGMLIEVDRVLPGQGDIRVQFYLPGETRPLQLLGRILRAEFDGSTPKYGVRFVEPGSSERDCIERYVHRMRSRELI